MDDLIEKQEVRGCLPERLLWPAHSGNDKLPQRGGSFDSQQCAKPPLGVFTPLNTDNLTGGNRWVAVVDHLNKHTAFQQLWECHS